jgi:hypothetical protein
MIFKEMFTAMERISKTVPAVRLRPPAPDTGKWLLLGLLLLFPARTAQTGRSTLHFAYPGNALIIRCPEPERARLLVPPRGTRRAFPAIPSPDSFSYLPSKSRPAENVELVLRCPAYISVLELITSAYLPRYNRFRFIPEEQTSDSRRRPDRRISMRDELIEIEDLDNGQYGAAIVRDAASNQDFRGFLEIPTVWGQQLAPPDMLKRSVSQLAESLNRYTGISARVKPHLFVSSHEIFRTPFLFITTDRAFELTPLERENLGRYLRGGGFVFADNGTPQYDQGAAEASLRQMFRDTLGCHARFEPIPASHPLYRCYFDFRDGAPNGAEVAFQSTDTVRNWDANTLSYHQPVFYLEGVFLDNRLVAVYSNKGYALKWKDMANNEPQLKFGVNLLVYALTREGGITDRNMMNFKDFQ